MKKTKQKTTHQADSAVCDHASLPRSIRTSVVELFDVRITCHLLDDGRLLLSQRGVNELFLCPNGGRNDRGMPRFAISPVVTPFLADIVGEDGTKPVPFVDSRSGRVTTAIDMAFVTDVCAAWIHAYDVGTEMTCHQVAVTNRAEAFMRRLARVGLVALMQIESKDCHQTNRA